MKELLIPESEVILRFDYTNLTRKTDASIVGVYVDTQNFWVSIDSQLANRFILKLWRKLPVLETFSAMKAEVTYGESRLDFQFKDKNNFNCLVEVKTATLVEDGIAKFPDAPTLRGIRHVEELIKARKNGYRSIVIFIVPRIDAFEIRPNLSTDPNFANIMKIASKKGVEFLSFRCSFTPEGLLFDQEIPVIV